MDVRFSEFLGSAVVYVQLLDKSDIIAIAAVSISIWTLLSNRGYNKRIVAIETARDNKSKTEEAKAQLVVSVVPESDIFKFIIIENKGSAPARDVRMSLSTGKADPNDNYVIGPSGQPILLGELQPMIIGPHSSKTIRYLEETVEARIAKLSLSWSDESSDERSYETSV